MYYQILIETVTSRRLYETDLQDEEIVLKDIIIPYLQNESFLFDGSFLKYEDVERMIIKSTTSSAKALAEHENNSMPEGLIMYVEPNDIIGFEEYTTDVTKKIFDTANERIKSERLKEKEYQADIKEEPIIDKTKVFIVHGHDELALKSVILFIRQLGFTPIVIADQANEGNTIIEKIEEHSNVGFGIVLYTACDVGSKKGEEDNLRFRARQNVVFEHGFLIGKIGRRNVAALVKDDNIEKPNDMSGIVYINMDVNEGWHMKLAKELKSSGYDVDMNRFFE